jgi:hypothetical protein
MVSLWDHLLFELLLKLSKFDGAQFIVNEFQTGLREDRMAGSDEIHAQILLPHRPNISTQILPGREVITVVVV